MGYKVKHIYCGTNLVRPTKMPGYQEVEYIQSNASNPGATSGTFQYINTNFIHTPNTEIAIDMQFTTTAIQQRLFSSDTNNSSYSTFVAYINGSRYRARSAKDGAGDFKATNVSADTNRHKFVLNKDTYKIYTNGTLIYNGNNANIITKNGEHALVLLCEWTNSSPNIRLGSSAKLYSCQIKDNNVLVRDFIPCYRKSDNVIGLYDLVNKQFYTNAGSGTFTKGPDVN